MTKRITTSAVDHGHLGHLITIRISATPTAPGDTTWVNGDLTWWTADPHQIPTIAATAVDCLTRLAGWTDTDDIEIVHLNTTDTAEVTQSTSTPPTPLR